LLTRFVPCQSYCDDSVCYPYVIEIGVDRLHLRVVFDRLQAIFPAQAGLLVAAAEMVGVIFLRYQLSWLSLALANKCVCCHGAVWQDDERVNIQFEQRVVIFDSIRCDGHCRVDYGIQVTGFDTSI
jgi:hypothetical protein